MMREHPNMARLIGDMALGIANLRLRAHEGARCVGSGMLRWRPQFGDGRRNVDKETSAWPAPPRGVE
jgi:hypothetical protein